MRRPRGHRVRAMPRPIAAAVALLGVLATAGMARAFDFGPLSVHGYTEMQLRAIADNYQPKDVFWSQWANVLDLEADLQIAPDGFGPVDSLSAFGRVLVRYDCIYAGCGVVPSSWRYYGNHAKQAPPNMTDARKNPYSGVLLIPGETGQRIDTDHRLDDFFAIPPFDDLRQLGASNLDATFAPISDARFAMKNVDSSIGNAVFPLGPWQPKTKIDPDGSLSGVEDPTSPLPLRPAVPPPQAQGGLYAHGLYVPSQAYVQEHGKLNNFEQNYDQADLAWYHVQSQDTKELKELYLDADLFDGRLWIRAGKQSIVWGKTELFRTTDQFNPQTLSLSSLPTLEESRIPLWSARGVWSFYDIGPLEDVRLEVATNLQDFEPLDLGRCGMPYAVWLVCGKTFGLWSHGFAGIGLAGETRPPSPWQSLKGWEVGARVEFRYDRFSFQISDFWGYEDAPTIQTLNEYARNVDPNTGRPLDVNGNPLYNGESASAVLALHPANRQLYDVLCSATVGIATAAFGGSGAPQEVKDACLLDISNSQFTLNQLQPPPVPFPIKISEALSVTLTGNANARLITGALAGGGGSLPPGSMVELNKDPADGPGGGFFGTSSLSAYLTNQQEALLGCGPFYSTNCDTDGIDLFNAEASVLIQSFPQFEPGGPVATRYANGRLIVLPGARGPSQPGYSPYVDGCIGPGPTGCNAGDPGRSGPSAHRLLYPAGSSRAGQPFANELGAASYNFLILLAALGAASGNDPGCTLDDPFQCKFVQGVFGVAGIRRPEIRAGGNGIYGRRDFLWAGGSELELRYVKRNVLGFAMDFAHDATETNWSLEATWMAGEPYVMQSVESGWKRHDTYNLTVSVDRPTFIRFLNQNRTFFFNSQWFFRWIADYQGGGAMGVHGPFTALGTLTATTGYFQDRLLPAVTWVHDVRSVSGGLIGQVSYRFNQDFSVTVGAATFYGRPDKLQYSISPVALSNQGNDYKANLRYDGLSAIAERDELFLLLRYTF
jgi:hypothetical protein